jgi:4-amino-4-deoxy-L-arabinose transferase-like glycosyltransferase
LTQDTKTPAAAASPSHAWFWPWVMVGLILFAAAAIRLRVLDLPLERDEGEYAYAGQLLLDGVPPYTLAYNMKFPGVYAAYALAMALFGQTAGGVHLGLILVNAAAIVLVFLLGRRLFNAETGVAAAAGYALLSLSPSVLGLAGHATHFVVPAALGGLLLLLRGLERRRRRLFIWSGVCLGLALLMKQPAALWVVFAALYLAWTEARNPERRWGRLAGRLGLLAAGVAAPLALTGLLLGWAGVFGRFWHWTFAYAAQYGTRLSLGDGWAILKDCFVERMGPGAGLWVLAGLGLAGLIVAAARQRRPLADRKVLDAPVFVAGLLVFSFLATSAGLYWRNHYFILMLPAVALLAGVAVSSGRQALARAGRPKALQWAPAGLFLAVLAYAVVQQREAFFEWPPDRLSHEMYGLNPFPESIPIARYLREHTAPEDRVAVLGSEPQIYFYAHRHSATGHIYTYALMEPQPYAAEMQREMISEIETAEPKFVVLVSPQLNTSWLAGPQSDPTLFRWIFGEQPDDTFLRDRYAVIGLMEFLPRTAAPRSWEDWVAVARWGPAAAAQGPRSPYCVFVLQRRDAAPRIAPASGA